MLPRRFLLALRNLPALSLPNGRHPPPADESADDRFPRCGRPQRPPLHSVFCGSFESVRFRVYPRLIMPGRFFVFGLRNLRHLRIVVSC